MSDGKCHEVKDERSQRSCHTEYCGISDPCVIPFVVHLILAFRGIDNNLWDKVAESSVIEAFASSVKDARGHAMFESTDVELLMTSPWSEEVLDANGASTGEMSQVIGTKAVIEVHIHNPNAFISEIDADIIDPPDNIHPKVPLMLTRKHKAAQKDAECKSSDLFELAQKAHEIHDILGRDEFMKGMVKSLQSISASIAGGGSQVLSPLVTNQDNVEKSRVVSSWTIKTAIGGGSIYDHKLDPFPGPMNYVHVSPAYLPLGLTPMNVFSIIVLAVMATNIFKRNSRRKEKHNERKNNFIDLSSMTFNPKPFEMVRRKLGVHGLKKGKPFQGGIDDASAANLIRKDNESVYKNSKCRSRLNDIITN